MLEKILEEIEEEHNSYEAQHVKSYEKGLQCAADIIRKHMNDGWIPCDERCPEVEAEKFIKEELDGIGYLYPCLLTYRSPNTEHVNVVRFYYDVHEKWFVNAGEKTCEKERCIAWRPLPEPYRPEKGEQK